MSDADRADAVDGSGDLTDRVIARDPDAWEHLYRTRYRALYGFAHRRLFDSRMAEDAVSETMTRALNGVARFEGAGGSLDAWLFGIARNVVLELGRATKRIGVLGNTTTLTSTVRGPEDAVVADAERDVLRTAFARLDQDEQELLELRVHGKLSADDVGRLLGKRPGAVRMAQARALQRLRTFVEEVDRDV